MAFLHTCSQWELCALLPVQVLSLSLEITFSPQLENLFNC